MTEQQAAEVREIVRKELMLMGLISPPEPLVTGGYVKELNRVMKEFARKKSLQQQARP